MHYQILADLVIALHLAFILFVVFGGFLAIKYRFIIWLHIPAFIWGSFVEFSGTICPLTPLENSLRLKAGIERYSGDFIDKYLVSIIYPEGLTRQLQVIFGIFVLLINGFIYWFLYRTRQRSTGKEEN